MLPKGTVTLLAHVASNDVLLHIPKVSNTMRIDTVSADGLGTTTFMKLGLGADASAFLIGTSEARR
jgi:hypothetical protein